MEINDVNSNERKLRSMKPIVKQAILPVIKIFNIIFHEKKGFANELMFIY
ncbi:MAG: hypothetical protein QW128_05745 [Thermoprotei archaeon]